MLVLLREGTTMMKQLPAQKTAAPAKSKSYRGGDFGAQSKTTHAKGEGFPGFGKYKSGGKGK
jgi:hypothetical protein